MFKFLLIIAGVSAAYFYTSEQGDSPENGAESKGSSKVTINKIKKAGQKLTADIKLYKQQADNHVNYFYLT